MKKNLIFWLLLFIKLTIDIFSVNIAFILAYFLISKLIPISSLPSIKLYTLALVFVTMTWLVIFNLFGFYKIQIDESSQRVDRTKVIIWGTVLSAIVTLFVVTALYRKEAIYFILISIVFFAWIISAFLLVFAREKIRFLERKLLR